MTEPEKMEALKRVYAEMILNTAKEAAARVLAAELRARRLEEDSISAKEETARMLLRLKLMIDAQNKEAEIVSLNQQRKIDELECQLNEAEGVILDLRAELNQVQEHLDEAKQKVVRQNENTECYMISKGEDVGPLQSETGHLTVDGKLSTQIKEPEKSNPCNNSTYTDNMNEKKGNHNGVSFVRRTNRKRKLKFWGDYINARGKRRPRQFKKTRWSFLHPSRCKSTKFLKSTKSCMDKIQTEDETQDRESLHCAEEFLVEGSGNAENLSVEDMELIDVLVQQDELEAKFGLNSMKSCTYKFQIEDKTRNEKSLDVAEECLIEAPVIAENLSEKDMELIDVLVEQDELAAKFGLNSSSRVDCDVEGVIGTEASNANHAVCKRVFKYTFSRRQKKNSII